MVAILSFCGAMMLAELALAQVPPVRYQPTRPTISPYLNLLRRDVGPLPNYHSLVRPQLQQLANNQQQQLQLQQQRASIQANTTRLTQVEEVQSLSTAAPTGSAAGFRNYSHYYPGLAR
jgi:hypothetical protein